MKYSTTLIIAAALFCSTEFAGDTPATTVQQPRAVSSVVERLVYTELRSVFGGLTSYHRD